MNRLFHCPGDQDRIAEILERVESTAILNPRATHRDIRKACEDAINYGYGYLVPFRQYLPEVMEYLKGSPVKVVEGFSDMPLQSERLHTYETGLKMGCCELDMVGRMSLFFDKKYKEFQKDCREVVELANGYHAPVKVIIETGFLTDPEKILAAELALEAGASFIKLCVGMGQRRGRGTIHDVLLLKEAFGSRIRIKASSAIASLEDADAMIRAGADRVAVRSILAEQLQDIGYCPESCYLTESRIPRRSLAKCISKPARNL